MNALALVHLGSILLASSSSDSGSFGYVFLLSGFVFYGAIYLKYRNVGKRHHFERETQATKLNLQQTDEKFDSVTGVKNSKILGENASEVEGAGGITSTMDKLTSFSEKLGPFGG